MRLFFYHGLFLLFCFGCHHVRSDREMVSPLLELTEAEYQYVIKYGETRKKVTNFFHLSEDATAENLRPHVAGFLKLSKAASWDEMLQTPLIRRLCTNERREKLVAIFRLKPDATWVELGFKVEELWTQSQAAQ